MFTPPAEIETQVHVALPDSFRCVDRRSDWIVRQNLKPMHSFFEGPSFARDGTLYVTDLVHGRIFAFAPDGTTRLVADYDGEPNGLKIHQDGRIFVTDYRIGLVVIDPDSGRVTPVLDRYGTEGFKGLNDLVFASNGDVYFTDQGMTGLHDPTGRVFRLCADGRLDLLLANVPSPNGLVLNEDENMLYLAVTRANAIWRLPMNAAGQPFKVGVFLHLSGGGGIGGPDGLALDEAGNLIVAHAGLGTVWIFSPLGEPLYRIRSCAGLKTTNVAFGGADRTSLFITEADTGSVLKAQVPVPGRILYSHM